MRKAILMTLGMGGLLVAVIYAMQYVQSPKFRSALEVFLNPQAAGTWAWCPEGTDQIKWATSEIQAPIPRATEICILSTESASITTDDLKAIRPLVVAISGDKSRTLEASSDLSLFQIDGLPFRSQALTLMLRKLNFDFRVQE